MARKLTTKVEETAGYSPNRKQISFKEGNVYQHKDTGEEYLLLTLNEDNSAIFKSLKKLKTSLLSLDNFIHDDQQEHIPDCDLSKISDEQWKTAFDRYKMIEPLVTQHRSQRPTVAEIAKKHGIHKRTVQRWYRDYTSTKSIISLIPLTRGWRKGKRRLSKEIEELVNSVIKSFYLTPQKPTAEATVNAVYREAYRRGIPESKWPSSNAIRKTINDLDMAETLRARGQIKRARAMTTPKPGSFPTTSYPLEVVQIDHTPMDIIVVDDVNRQPIGRPFITVAIDIYSRMLTGYYISLDAPSMTSVGMCLVRSILPKQDLLAEYNIYDMDWDVYGLPKKIHVDNGADFRSLSLQRSCAAHGIQIEYRPLARPEYGGHVERFIGHIMKRVHELGGTTFSNIQEKAEYNSEKNACMTMRELEHWFLTYVVKVYHQSIHNTTKETPAQRWKVGIYGDATHAGIGTPPMPVDSLTLTLDFLPMFDRIIQVTGVTIDGIRYYDPILNAHINRADAKTGTKKKHIFRRDPRDISVIWFYDEKLRRYFKIPYADQTLPAMSIWEYEQIRAQVKKSKGTVNSYLIFRGWEEMQQIADKARQETNKTRRSNQRRKQHQKSQGYHKAEAIVDEQSYMIGADGKIVSSADAANNVATNVAVRKSKLKQARPLFNKTDQNDRLDSTVNNQTSKTKTGGHVLTSNTETTSLSASELRNRTARHYDDDDIM